MWVKKEEAYENQVKVEGSQWKKKRKGLLGIRQEQQRRYCSHIYIPRLAFGLLCLHSPWDFSLLGSQAHLLDHFSSSHSSKLLLPPS